MEGRKESRPGAAEEAGRQANLGLEGQTRRGEDITNTWRGSRVPPENRPRISLSQQHAQSMPVFSQHAIEIPASGISDGAGQRLKEAEG